MYLLDTDVTSNLFDAERTSEVLRRKVRATPLDEIAISVITFDEIIRGALAEVRKLDNWRRSVVDAYADLLRLYRNLTKFTILQFSTEAEQIYEVLPPVIKRIGTNDCRIAAIAMATGCAVVTANTRHFERIPGLKVEDWMRET